MQRPITVIQNLRATHLQGIPNAILYDGRLSVYDLALGSFGGAITLLEHFRCVPEIIQFSNQLSYEWKLKPLRDPSFVQLKPHIIAYRVDTTSSESNINWEEAWTVASLVAAATKQPEYQGKTFGVISLVGDEQALEIERLLRHHLAPDEYERRRILCGNAAQFQGDERDVMFLSVVDTSQANPLPLRNDNRFKQRFNVAASRARDQMWIVHSLDPRRDLQPDDLRRRLIEYAEDPSAVIRAIEEAEQRVESEFEREVMRRLLQVGYRVHPQWRVGHYRIDLVVEGGGRRLAVECDGDRFHPIEKLSEDMERQAILERLGWIFVRIRGSQFFHDPEAAMRPVFDSLARLGITPESLEPKTEKATETPGEELKERVIRQAQELRRKWREENDQTGLQEPVYKPEADRPHGQHSQPPAPADWDLHHNRAVPDTLLASGSPLGKSDLITAAASSEAVRNRTISNPKEVVSGKLVKRGSAPAKEKEKPSKKATPQTVVVSQLSQGQYATISEAIKSVQPGTRILVRPGSYHESESLIIDKSLEIIGDGSVGKIVIESTDSSCILMQTEHALVRGLTLRNWTGLTNKKRSAVEIHQGQLVLEDCDITSNSLSCVAILGSTANPVIRRCQIHDGKQCGVFIWNNGQGTVEDCNIFGNAFAGVEVREGGNPTVRRCTIRDGKMRGVFVYKNGQGIIEDCDIFGNAFAGVEIKQEGNPTVRACKIHGGKSAGVLVHEKGKGIVEDCDIFDNLYVGVSIQKGGNPSIRQCRVNRNAYQAIRVENYGAATVEDCDLTANERGAWYIQLGCHVHSSRNKI